MSETMHSLLSVIAALREERASLRSLLKSIEWKGDPELDYPICIVCGHWRPDSASRPYQGFREFGHASACALAAALGETP